MSSVSPYLLHVNSKPTKVSNDLWSEWYIKEHLPDLVSSKTSNRATFYKELPPLLGGEPPARNFLALYQTDYEESLKTEHYTNLRTTSELFPKEGGTTNIQDNGDFNARNYELIQLYDPKKIGNGMRLGLFLPLDEPNNSQPPDKPPNQILTVEMYPQGTSDFDKWYEKEHLDMMMNAPGFRRCLRYKLGPKTPQTKDDDPPSRLAIYEIDVNAKDFLTSEAAVAAGGTEWSKKHMAETKAFIVRGWERVHAEGF